MPRKPKSRNRRNRGKRIKHKVSSRHISPSPLQKSKRQKTYDFLKRHKGKLALGTILATLATAGLGYRYLKKPRPYSYRLLVPDE